MMMFHNTTNEFCWGTVWSRPGLSPKLRSLLTLGIAASHAQTGAVKMHTRTALKAGWSRKEIGEVLIHVYVYAGVYPSLSGFLAAKEVFDELDRETTEKKAEARKSKRLVKRRTAARTRHNSPRSPA
jgi:4-carboxymuconolactone decarboxylase